jgi:hypothetical protein
VISEIKKRAGAPTARTCRSIISGVMGLAVRYGAITVNPVREVDRIEHNAKELPRALTAEEVRLLREQLGTDERAVRAGPAGPGDLHARDRRTPPRRDRGPARRRRVRGPRRARQAGLRRPDRTAARTRRGVPVRQRPDQARRRDRSRRDRRQVHRERCRAARRDPGRHLPGRHHPQLGAAWIGPDDVQSFLREILSDRHLEVRRIVGSQWKITGGDYGINATSTWGTTRYSAGKLAEQLLRQAPIRVIDRIDETDVFNPVETEAAQEKARLLNERFSSWVWEDPARADRLARVYNDKFNAIVLRSYDTDHMTLPAHLPERPDQPAAGGFDQDPGRRRQPDREAGREGDPRGRGAHQDQAGQGQGSAMKSRTPPSPPTSAGAMPAPTRRRTSHPPHRSVRGPNTRPRPHDEPL